MVNYEIRTLSENTNLIVLSRLEKQESSPGLPPVSSRCIILEDDEIPLLLQTLNDYANKNGNQRV